MNRFEIFRRSAHGFVLIDALIAIVIFAIGILGMVAMQSAAVNYASDAQYRTQAAELVDQVIAQMWGSDPTQLTTNFAGAAGAGGPNYLTWEALVTDPKKGLPGAVANPPSITVNANNLVTVTIQWQPPNEIPPAPATAPPPHQYVSVTQITR